MLLADALFSLGGEPDRRFGAASPRALSELASTLGLLRAAGRDLDMNPEQERHG